MAYNVNGKVYTEHPLMDEIVYNCKQILKEIVIKNDVLAGDEEVNEEAVTNAEIFMMITDGSITFSVFPFTYEMFTAFGYNREQARAYTADRNDIPEDEKEVVFKFACDYFMENYVEMNRYYRMLMGLPEYGTDEYNIYIDDSYIPSNYLKEVDFTKPLHELDSSVIALLESNGRLNELKNTYKGSNYSYINFLGDKKIDLYTARKAKKWDILYMPPVESLVADKFKETYLLNRNIYLKRTYQEAYAFDSDYYEQCMIIMLLCQTFNDMVVDIPEWYIRRDIFDIRSVQYFLESYGVAYFKEIPLKYQIRIVKGLNKLIKYKSSNRNNTDILDIFDLDNTTIYKYYLYKKRLTDSKGNYIESESDEDKYELEFVQCELNDTYDNYIKDQIYRTPYDDITKQDKYWDGEEEHSYIKSLLLNRDFTIEGTKYMSIEYKISMSEYLFQMQYFLGLLLDSNLDTNDIKIGIPSIQQSVYFKLSDLFIMLFLLTSAYYEASSDVIYPKYDDSKIPKPEFTKYNDYDGGYSYTPDSLYDMFKSLDGKATDPDSYWKLNGDGGDNVEYSEIRSRERFYDWMKKQFPEMFINPKEKRVYGFNLEADLSKIDSVISRRHSNFQFRHGFSISELGVDKFINASSVKTISDLVSIYNTNKECYDNLKSKMVEDADNRDEFVVMQYVFESLFTKPFDENFYTLSNGEKASKLDEILADRDYILYNTYKSINAETNLETKQENIRNIMNDIINTLEYYLSADGLDYIFSFATVTSFNSLINYIYLMINFFKSYKVYFLDPYITYIADDKLENNAKPIDAIGEKKITFWKQDKMFANDVENHTIQFEAEERVDNSMSEVVDIYGHFEPDPDDDYDYDGLYANSDSSYPEFKDADGGYASDASCIPYIMLNGGSAEKGRMNLWDLNGANANEVENFVDVDGGYCINKDDYRHDYWGSAFTYNIDGGAASTNQFITRGIHTKVIDRQISSDIRISTASGNRIVNTEDGLYLQDSWIEYADFDEFKELSESTFNYFTTSYNRLYSDITIASDEDLLDERIEKCVNDYVGSMRKVLDYTDADKWKQSLIDYTDSKVAQLYDEFEYFNPFTWELF